MHSTRRRYVNRCYRDSLKFRYVLKTVKYGGFSILLWGAIKGDGTRILVRCPNRLNSEEYQRVSSKGLFEVYEVSNIFYARRRYMSQITIYDGIPRSEESVHHEWLAPTISWPQHNREYEGYFKGLETISKVDGWSMADYTKGMEGHLPWCHI